MASLRHGAADGGITRFVGAEKTGAGQAEEVKEEKRDGEREENRPARPHCFSPCCVGKQFPV